MCLLNQYFQNMYSFEWLNSIQFTKALDSVHYFNHYITTIFRKCKLVSIQIEHTFNKNVSKGPTFLTNTNSNDWLLIDYKKERSYIDTLHTHLHPLVWIFKRFGCPKWFWKSFVTTKPVPWNHSDLKYALARIRTEL